MDMQRAARVVCRSNLLFECDSFLLDLLALIGTGDDGDLELRDVLFECDQPALQAGVVCLDVG